MRSQKKYLTGLILSVAAGILFAGCGKKAFENLPVNESSKIEIPTPAPRKIKEIKLGDANDFSILAYSSISSIPKSSIGGKVGLMPGTRQQISIDPSEVAGGATDIFGNDDDTVPVNLLSNAKVDMVTVYNMASYLPGDIDKIGIYDGVVDEKILTPGVYEWKNSMTISKDFILSGSETDIWIFKVFGHLKVGEDVHMILSDGANAKNILWQVAGSVVLGAQSDFSGTIIAQPSIEMKKHSVLTGRAFCKNGYVNLDHAIIKSP